MLEIRPGKGEEFRQLQAWFAFSDRLDRLIEATELPGEPVPAPPPLPVAIVAAPIPEPGRGFRAALAAGLARVALALHSEAAAQAGLRPETEPR